MTTTTKERPIIFSGPMVHAILDGRKTQTRRPIKCCCNGMHLGRLLGEWGLSQPPFVWEGDASEVDWNHFGRKPKVNDWIEHYQTDVDDYASQVVTCPYGAPGDLLWVRETFCRKMDDGYFVYNAEGNLDPSCCHYKADGYHVIKDDGDGGTEYRKDGTEASPWVSPIRMPRWASRITLEVVSVRVERVQEITEEGAIAEGAQCAGVPASLTNRGAFAKLWKLINGPDSWDENPWVWVVEFRRLNSSETPNSSG